MAPLNYVRIARISLFARIVRDLSPTVITLLHITFNAPRSWLRAVIEDLEFVSTCSQGCRELSCLDFRGWVAFFTARGKNWVLALKKAFGESSCHSPDRHRLEHHAANDEQYVCNACGDIWATQQQLGVHLSRAHNRAHEIRRFITYPTSQCRHCLLERHTRQGLVEHLTDKRNAPCQEYVMSHTLPGSLREARLWNNLAKSEPDRWKMVGNQPSANVVLSYLVFLGRVSNIWP